MTQEPGKEAPPELTSLDSSREVLARLSSHAARQSRYKEEDLIGRGGMGAIVKIWDGDLRRNLAMKVVLGKDAPASGGSTPTVDDRTLGRFLEEAQVTGQLDHPGIVPVYDVGKEGGLPFFVMDFVPGKPLSQKLKEKGRLKSPEAARLIALVAPGERAVMESGGTARWTPLSRPVRLRQLEEVLSPRAAEPPRAEAAPRREVVPVSARAAHRGASGLVVEDNPVNQKVATKMLERLGCRARIAGSGYEAIAEAQHHTFDLILMDCQMPGMDGLEATQ